MGTDRYVIRGGAAGRERLRLLESVFGPTTRGLLAEVGIPAGSACLDVGCGGGDVTRQLADAAGPAGRAVGVDFDATALEIARREAGQQGLRNVTFEVRDITAWEPDRPFDVVYARFLLSHVAGPGEVVSAMRRHVRPAGAIIVEDVDFRGHFAEPDCPALRRFVDLYTRSVRSRGGDANIGPRLPGLLREAGFDDVGTRVVQPAALRGGVKLLTRVTLESVADAVLHDGLATEDELRGTIEELDAFVRDPHTVLGGPRVVQAWGRSGT